MRSGPVTARITKSAPDTVDCEAWGSGATEFTETLPAQLGADDDASGFCPEEPTIAAAYRRVPHLRLGRTDRVLEALIPAVLEQRVYGMDARRAWRALVTKFGVARPGPRAGAHAGAATWRCVAAHPVVGVSSRQRRPRPGPHDRRLRAARRLAGAAGHPAARARHVMALMSLPGVGEWTAAETAQRAFGDADALSVGDYHLASMVGWRLLGRPIDDPAMVELLEPLRPHRHRAVRLLEVTGPAHPPRRAARQAIPEFARALTAITAQAAWVHVAGQSIMRRSY